MSETICRICDKEVKDEYIRPGARYVNCRNCGMVVVVGNRKNVEQYRLVKGGNSAMAKKEEKKEKAPKLPKAPKEEKVKGPNIGEVRAENAKKVREFMKGVLNLNDVESRKVLSRCYGIISQGMKGSKK